jgi:hypothetical protein
MSPVALTGILYGLQSTLVASVLANVVNLFLIAVLIVEFTGLVVSA